MKRARDAEPAPAAAAAAAAAAAPNTLPPELRNVDKRDMPGSHRDHRSVGCWDAERGTVVLSRTRGKFFSTMGFAKRGVNQLFAEESAFLVFSHMLLLRETPDGEPLDCEGAFRLAEQSGVAREALFAYFYMRARKEAPLRVVSADDETQRPAPRVMRLADDWTQPAVSWLVYEQTKHFAKSRPGPPLFALVLCDAAELMPSHTQIQQAAAAVAPAPLRLGVVQADGTFLGFHVTTGSLGAPPPPPDADGGGGGGGGGGGSGGSEDAPPRKRHATEAAKTTTTPTAA